MLFQKNLRLSILPLIVLNRVYVKYDGNVLADAAAVIFDQDKNEDGESEGSVPVERIKRVNEEIEKFIFNLRKDKIELSHELTDEQIINSSQSFKFVK